MPSSRLFRFLFTGLIAVVAMIVPWYYLSPYLAAPVMSLAGQLMDFGFRWVVGFERNETVGTLLTSLNMQFNQNGLIFVAQLTPHVDYRVFGYGLVLFWALLIASRPNRMWLKMALGTLILVPSQVFSVCFRWLRIALLSNGTDVMSQAGVSRWMLEFIAYFDQLGFLIITPLMPVLLWLALDRAFVNKLWGDMVLAGSAEAARRASE